MCFYFENVKMLSHFRVTLQKKNRRSTTIVQLSPMYKRRDVKKCYFISHKYNRNGQFMPFAMPSGKKNKLNFCYRKHRKKVNITEKNEQHGYKIQLIKIVKCLDRMSMLFVVLFFAVFFPFICNNQRTQIITRYRLFSVRQ